MKVCRFSQLKMKKTSFVENCSCEWEHSNISRISLFIAGILYHGNLRVPPLCHVYPQEIAGLIKGLCSPPLSLNSGLNKAGYFHRGGHPLGSHDYRVPCSESWGGSRSKSHWVKHLNLWNEKSDHQFLSILTRWWQLKYFLIFFFMFTPILGGNDPIWLAHIFHSLPDVDTRPEKGWGSTEIRSYLVAFRQKSHWTGTSMATDSPQKNVLFGFQQLYSTQQIIMKCFIFQTNPQHSYYCHCVFFVHLYVDIWDLVRIFS